MDCLKQPYHQAMLNDVIPLSIGGWIGQSRACILLLRESHLGEVSVTARPDQLKEVCEERKIVVLE